MSNIKHIQNIFSLQKRLSRESLPPTVSERIGMLRRLEKSILRYKPEICRALYDDFRKSHAESDVTEILPSLMELRHARRNLGEWAAPLRIEATLFMATTRSEIRFEPRGSVLIIAPWNYAFLLAIGPLISALAAGNRVILKPSELTPSLSSLLAKLIGEIFPEDRVSCVLGGKEIAAELVALPFDHIFFTGSPEIGKKVMQAAAKNLVSLTLELGGKSPVIVDESANIKDAAKKIAWGKFFNAGQSCVAPDYVLIDKKRREEFLAQIIAATKKMYGKTKEERKQCPDFARIINAHHFRRLRSSLIDAKKKGAQIVFGGESDAGTNYIGPTIITNTSIKSTLMCEEIFGPILPVLTFENSEQAIQMASSPAEPLSLYVFARGTAKLRYYSDRIPSGNIGENEVVIQFAHQGLPFGGLNRSGIGAAHGYAGFRAFSHERSVLRHHSFSPFKLFYPPYSPWKEKLFSLFSRFL